MWENMIKGYTEVERIQAALESNTFIGVTDGLYNRERAGSVSGSGWVICCTRCPNASFVDPSPMKFRQRQARTGESYWA